MVVHVCGHRNKSAQGKLTMCMDAVVFDALDLTQHRMYILYIHSKIFLECECVTKLQECVDH